MFVLDASVTIAAILIEERTAEARAIMLTALNGVIVPALWHLEVGNILLRAQRRGGITGDECAGHLADLSTVPVTTDQQGSPHAWGATMDLARRHRLTLYDAAYLELAARLHIPLATFDTALARAATAEGVAVA